jgi:hypothetical protein
MDGVESAPSPLDIRCKHEVRRVANGELAGVKQAYGDVQVLRDGDLEVCDGEFMVFGLTLAC